MSGLKFFGRGIKMTLKRDPMLSSVSKDMLARRIESLGPDERKVFEWMMLCFSDSWIAETLMISRGQLRRIRRSLFFKLGVRNQTDMYRTYEFASVPANTVPDAGEIDGYVEDRTEKEIREMLGSDDNKSGTREPCEAAGIRHGGSEIKTQIVKLFEPHGKQGRQPREAYQGLRRQK